MSKKTTSQSDYEIGYGKPPKHTQFKKGISGNPGGKPKSKEDLKDLFSKEFGLMMKIKENGEVKSLSKGEVMIKALAAEACKGKLGASKLFFEYLPSKLSDSPAKPFSWTDEHEELFKMIVEGARKGADKE